MEAMMAMNKAGYHSPGGGGYGGGGGDMVGMKVTVALLVNVCVDIVDVVGGVVDEDRWLFCGCVDVVDVTGRVADGALGGGYESAEELRIEVSGVDTKVVREMEEIVELVIQTEVVIKTKVVMGGGGGDGGYEDDDGGGD
ncbi:hypothetical protein YC2023_073876 [Brassica napus]